MVADILILGTSNSLLKNGYGSILLKNKRYSRISIGDTTSLSGIYNILMLEKEDLLKYKYAILDFNVNEISFILSGKYPFKWAIVSFCYLLKYLIENEIIPIILLIHRKGFLWLESFQSVIAKSLNLPIIDIVYNIDQLDIDLHPNDSVHYSSEAQLLVAKTIEKKIEDLDCHYLSYVKLIKNITFPDFFSKFKMSLLNKKDIISNNISNITIKNSLFNTSPYIIKENDTFIVEQKNFLVAIVYWSDSNTPYVKFSCNNNEIIKNMQNKVTKPLLIVRSIGYTDEHSQVGNGQISLQLLKEITLPLLENKKIFEYTHNSNENIKLLDKDVNLLLENLIFSNEKISFIGEKLIKYFSLTQLDIVYQLWYLLKLKPETYLKGLIFNKIKKLTNFTDSIEYLYYLAKYEKKDNVFEKISFQSIKNSYYYLLLGNFFSSNLDKIKFFFNKAIELNPIESDYRYIYALKLYCYNDYINALKQVNISIHLKDNYSKAIELKNKIINTLTTSSNDIIFKYTEERGISSFPNLYFSYEKNFENKDIMSMRKFLNDKSFSKKLIEYKAITIGLEDISSHKQIPQLFTIKIDNLKLDCLCFFSSSPKLYVSLFSGKRKDYNTPHFTRWSYNKYLDGIFLCIDDPSVKINKEFSLDEPTWYYGNEENNIFMAIEKLINKISIEYNILKSNITILGSSSAGYASLYLGSKIDGINVIALSPQIAPALWKTSTSFEKKTKISLSDVTNNKNNLSPLIKKSSSLFFIIFNEASKEDVIQIMKITNTNDIKYGISSYSNNIFFWKHFTLGTNPHNSNPEILGITIADWLLRLAKMEYFSNRANFINSFNNFSKLISDEHAEKSMILREFKKIESLYLCKKN